MVRTTYSLADLPEGSTGTIRDIDALSPTARRLLDMGFVPGTPIKAIKRAPMGDPTTYEVDSATIPADPDADLIEKLVRLLDLTDPEDAREVIAAVRTHDEAVQA